jgi:hypothetical protein
MRSKPLENRRPLTVQSETLAVSSVPRYRSANMSLRSMLSCLSLLSTFRVADLKPFTVQ